MKVIPSEGKNVEHLSSRLKLYYLFIFYLIVVCAYFYFQTSSAYNLADLLRRSIDSDIDYAFASPNKVIIIVICCSMASIVPSVLEFFMDWLYEPELFFQFYERIFLITLVIIPNVFILSYNGSPIQSFAFICCFYIQISGATAIALSLCNRKVPEVYGENSSIAILLSCTTACIFHLIGYGYGNEHWANVAFLIIGSFCVTALVSLFTMKLLLPAYKRWRDEKLSPTDLEMDAIW